MMNPISRSILFSLVLALLCFQPLYARHIPDSLRADGGITLVEGHDLYWALGAVVDSDYVEDPITGDPVLMTVRTEYPYVIKVDTDTAQMLGTNDVTCMGQELEDWFSQEWLNRCRFVPDTADELTIGDIVVDKAGRVIYCRAAFSYNETRYGISDSYLIYLVRSIFERVSGKIRPANAGTGPFCMPFGFTLRLKSMKIFNPQVLPPPLMAQVPAVNAY